MNHSEIVGFLWRVADLIRDPFKRGKYQDVILPLTVLRRLDCVLLIPAKPKPHPGLWFCYARRGPAASRFAPLRRNPRHNLGSERLRSAGRPSVAGAIEPSRIR